MQGIPEIDVRQLQAEKSNGFDGYIVDVREDSEIRQSGVIPGAIHIPLGVLPKRAEALPKDGTAVVVCRSGARSRLGATLIAATGRRAVNLAGGMLDWVRSGYEVERR